MCIRDRLKLEPLLDRSIFSLSGGEKQKIACGSAAAIDPDVYVLDEPSSNLDAYALADFRQLLFTLKSQGKTSSVLDSMQTTLGNLSQTSGSMAQVFDGVDSTLDTLNMSMTQLKGVIAVSYTHLLSGNYDTARK